MILITQEMVDKFNNEILKSECMKIIKSSVNNCWEIEISNRFIKHATINLSDEFYSILESYFKSEGIDKISYNNTGTTIWATYNE